MGLSGSAADRAWPQLDLPIRVRLRLRPHPPTLLRVESQRKAWTVTWSAREGAAVDDAVVTVT
jgi:hypothetical protein